MSIVPINQGHGNGSNSSQGSWDPTNALSSWDPFMDFHFPIIPPSISSFFPDIGFGSGFGSSLNTRMDWRETPRAHVWKVVLPGFTDEDVLVELQDERVLQVSVDSGNFVSRFKVPEDGNLQELKANMMPNGVLVITVPKFEQPSVGGGRNIRVVEIEGSDD